MKLAKIIKRRRIDKPEKFKLSNFDPAECFGLSTDIEEVRAILAEGVARLEDMQERLYAHARWSVLIVLQGMDAAGKDGVINHGNIVSRIFGPLNAISPATARWC